MKIPETHYNQNLGGESEQYGTSCQPDGMAHQQISPGGSDNSPKEIRPKDLSTVTKEDLKWLLIIAVSYALLFYAGVYAGVHFAVSIYRGGRNLWRRFKMTVHGKNTR
jgi:hypothetical protein